MKYVNDFRDARNFRDARRKLEFELKLLLGDVEVAHVIEKSSSVKELQLWAFQELQDVLERASKPLRILKGECKKHYGTTTNAWQKAGLVFLEALLEKRGFKVSVDYSTSKVNNRSIQNAVITFSW